MGVFWIMFENKFKIQGDLNFIELKKRVADLELELSKLKSHIVSLRGFVNRKLLDQFGEEPGEEFKSKESIDGLDSLRK